MHPRTPGQKNLDQSVMKFARVSLSLLAVLARSVPVEFTDGLQISPVIAVKVPPFNVTVENRLKIKKKFYNLAGTVTVADIDPTEVYREDNWDVDAAKKADSFPGLREKMPDFVNSFGNIHFQTTNSSVDYPPRVLLKEFQAPPVFLNCQALNCQAPSVLLN